MPDENYDYRFLQVKIKLIDGQNVVCFTRCAVIIISSCSFIILMNPWLYINTLIKCYDNVNYSYDWLTGPLLGFYEYDSVIFFLYLYLQMIL